MFAKIDVFGATKKVQTGPEPPKHFFGGGGCFVCLCCYYMSFFVVFNDVWRSFVFFCSYDVCMFLFF